LQEEAYQEEAQAGDNRVITSKAGIETFKKHSLKRGMFFKGRILLHSSFLPLIPACTDLKGFRVQGSLTLKFQAASTIFSISIYNKRGVI
jgi:hypothetical protein